MEPIQRFYLTFGQKYPWRNGYVLVEALSYEIAREWVVEIFGSAWSHLYREKDFDFSFFPAGQLGETIK